MSRLADTVSTTCAARSSAASAALLDEIAARRQRLYVLKAYGVARPACGRSRPSLQRSDDELAEVTDAATTLRAVA